VNIAKYISGNDTLKKLDFMTVYITIIELIKDGEVSYLEDV
jgi:hypothetical protein